jgi:hypothetical protein
LKQGKLIKSRRLVVVDQGNAELSNLIARSDNLKPPFYFVHVHLTDDFVYLKLYQTSDLQKFNIRLVDPSTVFVVDKFVPITSTFDQACELLWEYVHSGEAQEKMKYAEAGYSLGNTPDNYKQLKAMIPHLLSSEVYTNQNQLKNN